MAIFVGEHDIQRFDDAIILFVQGFETPWLTSIMKLFTTIGSTPVVILLSILILIVLYKVLHHRVELILFLSVILGTAILNEALKYLFHRARPTTHRLTEATGFSFPSGHSMEAFALYGVLAFLLWRHIPTQIGRIILILISMIMILLIGTSRIYLGVHYPSDVFGGYFASGFWLAATIWIYLRYQEKRERSV